MIQAGVGEIGRTYNGLADKLIRYYAWNPEVVAEPDLRGKVPDDIRLPPYTSRIAMFKWLQNTLPELAYTLILLCFATPDPHIPMEMVTNLENPPKHWNCEGKEEPGPKLGMLEVVGASIKPLIKLTFIQSIPEKDGWAIPLDIWEYAKRSVEGSMQRSLDALSLVCNIFPKHPKLDMQ